MVNRHLLAVPRDLIQCVGGDPVVAGAAHDQVHARRTVPGEDHIGARSGVDGVILGVELEAAGEISVVRDEEGRPIETQIIRLSAASLGASGLSATVNISEADPSEGEGESSETAPREASGEPGEA